MSTVIDHNERRGIMSSGYREYHYSVARLSCGHVAPGTINHILGIGSIPPLGAEVECVSCANERASRALVAQASADGHLSHTRVARVGSGIDVYVYDSTSPTGVHHLTSLPDTPDTYAFLRTLDRHLSPLSPTESR